MTDDTVYSIATLITLLSLIVFVLSLNMTFAMHRVLRWLADVSQSVNRMEEVIEDALPPRPFPDCANLDEIWFDGLKYRIVEPDEISPSDRDDDRNSQPTSSTSDAVSGSISAATEG